MKADGHTRQRHRPIPMGEQIGQKFAHLGAAAKARREGRPLPWDDPAWQERIRQAKQRVAEYERSQGTQ